MPDTCSIVTSVAGGRRHCIMISRSTWHHLLSTVSTPGTMVSRKLISIFYEMILTHIISNQGMKTSENNFYHEKYSFTFCSFTFDFLDIWSYGSCRVTLFSPSPSPSVTSSLLAWWRVLRADVSSRPSRSARGGSTAPHSVVHQQSHKTHLTS